jgi:KipI family sensor histidine kinase inhibitor
MTAVRMVAAGDAAIVAEFDERIDPQVNARAIALADALRAASIAGVRDIVPTFRSVAVHFDPLATDLTRLRAYVRESSERPIGSSTEAAPCIDIPVCYDREFAIDIDAVSTFAGGLSDEAVVALHSATTYRVFMLGFMPGFAYLGSVDARLALPRRASPRLEVAAGSVGIAGQQTGVYAVASPGGWNIVGRTPLRMVSLGRPDPSVLKAGDQVRFRPISRQEFDDIAARQERLS